MFEVRIFFLLLFLFSKDAFELIKSDSEDIYNVTKYIFKKKMSIQ